ncbi:hypothetical protein ACLOJK_012037 [Asimina triloba]
MRLLRFNVRMAQVVDFSNLCLLAHVAAKVKEEEDQEKENHAAVVGDESHREISIKQQEEEHHHDDYGDESRMIMAAKKRKREHVDMPFNCNKLIRSPTSSSCGRGRDHHHHHGPSESKSAHLDLQQTADGQRHQTPSEPSLTRGCNHQIYPPSALVRIS